MNESTQPVSPDQTPTVPRRLIREAAVQLLHSSLSKTSATEEAGDPWPLILAQPEAKITRLRARAILHLQQNRPSRAKPFLNNRVNTLPLLESFVEERSAQKAYRELFKAEETLPDLFDLLRRQLKSEKEPEAVSDTIQRIQEQNRLALENLNALGGAIGALAGCPDPLKPLAKAIPPLRETAETLRALLSDTPPELRELQTLHNAITERNLLRKHAEELQQLVLSHLAETDKLIAAQLQNFSPERLGQVDRNVMRMAATELHYCPEIPSAVSINEAIEIVRRFGDTESASFVNGILDKLVPKKSA